MGGDGTLSYCINNNICNDKLIYIIPTGSGNGLAKNLNICNIKDSINALNCDNKVKIKLQNIKYNNKSKKSFLYITLGLISDIDIDSEWLRYIGDTRFYYGIIKFLLLGKVLKCYLSYCDQYDHVNDISGDFCMFCSGKLPWISNDFNMIPNINYDDDLIDIIYIDRPITFIERCIFLYWFIKKKHIDCCDFIKHIRVKNYVLEKFNDDSKFVYDGEVLNTNKISVNVTSNMKQNHLHYSLFTSLEKNDNFITVYKN